MQKIVLTGPESTGKTSLAKDLAAAFGTIWVPEYSRDYLTEIERPYVEADLRHIARGQLLLEESMAELAPSNLMFIDTSLMVLKVWSEYRFGRTAPEIEAGLRENLHDFYLLCTPDLPWEPDPFRENPHDREQLLGMYVQQLKAYGKSFALVKGLGGARLAHALRLLDSHLGLRP